MFVIVSSKHICFLWKLINGKFYHDKRSTPEAAKKTTTKNNNNKTTKNKNKTGFITECFCAMQPYKVDDYDSLQEDILDTISVPSKLYFYRYNECNSKYLDIYINK